MNFFTLLAWVWSQYICLFTFTLFAWVWIKTIYVIDSVSHIARTSLGQAGILLSNYSHEFGSIRNPSIDFQRVWVKPVSVHWPTHCSHEFGSNWFLKMYFHNARMMHEIGSSQYLSINFHIYRMSLGSGMGQIGICQSNSIAWVWLESVSIFQLTFTMLASVWVKINWLSHCLQSLGQTSTYLLIDFHIARINLGQTQTSICQLTFTLLAWVWVRLVSVDWLSHCSQEFG